MIRDSKLLDELNDRELRSEKPDYHKALRVFEALWQEGVSLGVLPLEDSLEGIEVDIRIARILNSVRSPDRETGGGS